MPVKNAGGEHEASPFLRYKLAIGEWPPQRLPGWVQAEMTNGRDNVPQAELVARYGAEPRQETAVRGFEPHCDVPLSKQSPAAQQAARRWAEMLVKATTC